MDKAEVGKALREISLYLQLNGENAFKSRAYDVAADRVLGLSEDLGAIVREGRLEDLPGIGEALAQKITELVTTGKLDYLEDLRAVYPPGILELLRLPDLGPKKVAALWRELKVGDVATLEQACQDGRLRGLKGFGAKSEQKILAGIALFKRSKERHLLGDVLPLAQELLVHVKAAPGVVRASLGGSVRRARETVGDVDLIASAPEAKPVFDAFVGHPLVAEVIGRGESKCSVRLRERDLQIDLRVLPDADFATALHHFTGSKAHHIRLRGLALDRGLSISEWGLTRGEEKLPVPDEASLYAALGMQHVPPELREDAGEVEAALAHALPEDLVREEDVLGAVHSHSTWSDGRSSLEDMARAAQALGLRYLTVTEHSQAAAYAHGLAPDRLQQQWEEIDRINEAMGPDFRLLKGLEVDILETGALDLDDAWLDRLEVVIGSIHQRHGLDEARMTARVLRAIEHPRLQILGHLTGRLIQEREPYPLTLEPIFELAAERGVAIEVNGNPHRLDLKAEHVRMALARKVKLVTSVDAHSIPDLRNVRYAVATARRGWARRGDVLNTLDAEGFRRALRGARA